MKLFIKGKMFDKLDTMSVTDADSKKLGDIEQRDVTGLVSFAVLMDGAEVAVVERKSKTSIQPNFIVKGPDWEVAGSIFSAKYKVTKGGKNIATLKVALLKSELDITDDADPVVVLAIVMAIRNMLFRASIVGAAAAVGV